MESLDLYIEELKGVLSARGVSLKPVSPRRRRPRAASSESVSSHTTLERERVAIPYLTQEEEEDRDKRDCDDEDDSPSIPQLAAQVSHKRSS